MTLINIKPFSFWINALVRFDTKHFMDQILKFCHVICKNSMNYFEFECRVTF